MPNPLTTNLFNQSLLGTQWVVRKASAGDVGNLSYYAQAGDYVRLPPFVALPAVQLLPDGVTVFHRNRTVSGDR